VDHDNNLNLIRKAVAGDINAYEKLIKGHFIMLNRLVMCKVRIASDRDDVLQEILLIVWLNIKRLKKPEAFKTWIIRIANNCCNKWYKRNAKVDEPLEADMLMSILDGRIRCEIKPEINDFLIEEVNQLPEVQKSAIEDFYFNNLKISEISYTHQIPAGTVKRRLHDGRINLRKKLEDKK